MISALVFFALIVNASGQCGDDMVPLVVGKLPAEWNIGTIPHFFLNSAHLRGVMSTRDFKIFGLETVQASLQFCPVNLTIYGALSARRIQVTGNYTSNVDYLTHGTEVFLHGAGVHNVAIANFEVKNLVAPLRYSRTAKRLQIGDMQYDASEEITSPGITGSHVDGENEHLANTDEIVAIHKSNSNPSLVEFIRAVINYKSKDKILFGAVTEMFATAFPL